MVSFPFGETSEVIELIDFVVGTRGNREMMYIKVGGRKKLDCCVRGEGVGWVEKGGGANLCIFGGFHGVGTRMKIYASSVWCV
jgi:hypothetical protein